ncbi:hypothetical protein F183_A17530 [Bryobacterales bacterium F-183]|nr:hypothetical protein F183_A17530 [Bryobacterales bacterium F-183]
MEFDSKVLLSSGIPSGVVVYPKNNGRLKTLVLYKDVGGKTGFLWGTAKPKEKGSAQYLYPVALDSEGPRGTKIKVMGPKGLGKNNAPARVCDPDSGKEIGTFRWEEVKLPDGSQRERPDSTGEFQVIAKTFQKKFLASTYGFGNVHDDVDDSSGTGEQTRENFWDVLDSISASNLDYFAYAGHGNWDSLGSAQVRAKDVDEFVRRLRRLVKPEGVILFYACLTGKTGGFASKVAGALPGATVWGHSDSGQASRNADKVVHKGTNNMAVKKLLSAAAAKNLSGYLVSSEDFYARMPFMTIAEMNAELEAFIPAKK